MLLVWMSRSAIPAWRRASRTRAIRVAACWIAPLAVADRVTPPALMIATSGTRVTSPVAFMSSRVPAIVWVIAGACCAWAEAGTNAVPSASAARIGYFMRGVLYQSLNGGSLARQPWLFDERFSPASGAVADNQPGDEQDQKRAQNAGNEACALVLSVPADRMTDPSRDQGAGDA